MQAASKYAYNLATMAETKIILNSNNLVDMHLSKLSDKLVLLNEC